MTPLFLLLAALQAPTCNAALWAHVYRPARLTVLQACATVTGTIVDATAGRRKDGVRHEADGDTHGWLRVDPAFAGLLDDGNRTQEAGNLVYEVVCAFRVTQADAKAACRGYRSTVALQPLGTHVAITGALVRDQRHARWVELHPVTAIAPLGR